MRVLEAAIPYFPARTAVSIVQDNTLGQAERTADVIASAVGCAGIRRKANGALRAVSVCNGITNAETTSWKIRNVLILSVAGARF
jgi:hypothetical protein